MVPPKRTAQLAFTTLPAVVVFMFCTWATGIAAQAAIPIHSASAAGPVRSGPAVQSQLPFSTVVAIATSSGLPNVMVIISQTNMVSDTEIVGSNYGGAWSGDGGRAWQPLSGLPFSDPPTRTVTYVRFDQLAIVPKGFEAQNIRIVVGNNTTILRSGDLGASWAQIEYGVDFFDLSITFRLLASPADPHLLYIAENGFEIPPFLGGTPVYWRLIHASTDAGVTWSTVAQNYSPSQVSPVVSGRLYAHRTVDGGITNEVSQSNDYGTTWVRRPSLDPVFRLTPDRVDPSVLYGVRAAAPLSDVGSITLDEGVTWNDWGAQPCETSREPGQLYSTDAQELWAICWQSDHDPSREVYFSSDAGANWRRMPNQTSTDVFAIDNAQRGRALLANQYGLWQSLHGGAWELLTADYGAYATYSLFLPAVAQ